MQPLSSNVVSELLYMAFNAVLYQRGLYPHADFCRARKWDLQLIVASNAAVKEYLMEVIKQIRAHWINDTSCTSELSEVSLIIVDSSERTVERWQFHLKSNNGSRSSISEVLVNELRKDLQKLMRQIGSTISFLPILRGKHAFRIAVSEHFESTRYTAPPASWREAEYREVSNAEEGEFDPITLDDVIIELKTLYAVPNGI